MCNALSRPCPHVHDIVVTRFTFYVLRNIDEGCGYEFDMLTEQSQAKLLKFSRDQRGYAVKKREKIKSWDLLEKTEWMQASVPVPKY